MHMDLYVIDVTDFKSETRLDIRGVIVRFGFHIAN